MFSQNIRLHFIGKGIFQVILDDPEVEALFPKYQGLVNVRVSKPEEKGSERQNRAFHALVGAYWETGMFSYPATSLPMLKIYIKLAYGTVWKFDIDGDPVRIPKSWADMSCDERATMITGLMAELEQTGAMAASRKLREIREGMSDE
jgi:hypothetical protein